MLRVHTTSDLVDTTCHLRIQQRDGGVLARQWALGCVRGDDQDIGSIRWVSSEELWIELSRGPSGTIKVRVDPTSGRPLSHPESLQRC